MRVGKFVAAAAAIAVAAGGSVASAAVQFLQDYESTTPADIDTNNQLFLRRPGLSGSNTNVAAGSAADLSLVSPGLGLGGNQALQVLTRVTTPGDPQRLRFLVDSDGNVDLNLPQSGTIGFLLQAPQGTPSDLEVGFVIEDTARGDLEVLSPTSVISDGTARLYQFNLGPGTTTTPFSSFFGGSGLGNGTITGTTFNPDSIAFRTQTGSEFTFVIDSIAFNPDGDLSALVPEPGALGILALGGLGLLARRRRA